MSFNGPSAWPTRPMDGFGLYGLGVDAPYPAKPAGHAGLFIWAETVMVGLLLLMLSSALIGPLGNPDGVSDPPAWLRLMWLPAYAVVAALMIARAPILHRAWLGALVVLPIIGWVLMSKQWSLEPDVTQRRALALVFPTLFALFLAARYDWRALLRVIATISVILAIGSVIAAVLFPRMGIDHGVHVGAWKGVFFEKNGMGGFMVRGTLACLAMMSFSRKSRWWWLGGALICSLLVVKSTSTTALVNLVMVYAGVIAIRFLRISPAFAVTGLWLAVAGLILIGVVFVVAPDFFFNLVGKDSSLTGRTRIWAALMRQIDLRPWEGYGYGAFWRSKPTGPAAWVALQADWAVLAADNAWAEILVQLGWMGVGLFCFTLVFFIPAALLSVFQKGPGGYWAPLFLTVLLMTTITESVLLRQNDLTWVLYVATLAKLLQGREPPAETQPWT